MLEELKEQNLKLKTEKDSFSRCDPKRYVGLKKEATTSKENANRWVDNIFTTVQYLKKSRPELTSETLEDNFPILKDLDYLE